MTLFVIDNSLESRITNGVYVDGYDDEPTWDDGDDG